MEQDELEWKSAQDTFVGYPCNLEYNYDELFPYMKYHFNNVGPPDEPSLYRVHTKRQEQNVLHFFQELWGFEPNNTWGYITSNGTEGNLQALYIARQLFPNAVVYTSKDTHYSIPKICSILNVPLCIVNSRENGEMDYDDFERCLVKNKDRPVIVNANLGTTLKGATDSTREIYRILCKHNKQDNYYMHADGALMGFVLPFLEKDLFFKKCIHSISFSGHKYLGVPIPCGVFMMEKRLLDIVKNHIEIIGTSDCTISGSRNGHSALFMDHIIQKKGYDGFKQDIIQCIDNSEYLIHQLQRVQIPSWRNQNSITVVFDKPKEHIVRKWQLANQGNTSHAIVLPHVTKPKINTFVKDMRIGKLNL
jgi:histidine decarboxylase